MELWLYAVNSLAWSAGGLFVGYLIGRTNREVHEIKEQQNDDDA